jgi:hypothetical protein
MYYGIATMLPLYFELATDMAGGQSVNLQVNKWTLSARKFGLTQNATLSPENCY